MSTSRLHRNALLWLCCLLLGVSICIPPARANDDDYCNVPCEPNKTLICYRLFFFSWNSCETDNSVRGLIPYSCGCCARDDQDGDGICDTNDICPGFDDLEDSDLNGIPDGCDVPIVEEPVVLPVEPTTVSPFPSTMPLKRPSASPSELPTIWLTDFPTVAPSDHPTVSPSDKPTSFPSPYLTVSPSNSVPSCGVAAKLNCQGPDGLDCESLVRRTTNCVIILAYTIIICNTKKTEIINVVQADLLLNGQRFDLLFNIDPMISANQCGSVTPRVEINACKQHSLLAEIVVDIGDSCGSSDSVGFSF